MEPLESDTDDEAFDEALPPTLGQRFGHLAHRVAEVLLALVLLLIAALTFWTAYDVLVHPPNTGATRYELLGISYAICFVAGAAVVFAARLAIPPLRLPGGRIIGFTGLWGFIVLYAAMMFLGLREGSVQAKESGLAMLLGVLLYYAIRRTIQHLRPGPDA